MKILKCKHCGNVIAFIHDMGVVPICCGEKMAEIKANSVDASNEKHVPVIEIKDKVVTVKVGSVIHPSTLEHHIEWVILVTSQGIMRKNITIGKDPVVTFSLTSDEQVIAAYEYCNLHGLWKKDN